MLDTKARKFVQPALSGVAKLLIKMKVSANHITLLALFVGLLPAGIIAFNLSPIAAVIVLWISGFFDALDGTIARITKTSSPLGTIMDIVFDRIVEISLILVLAVKHPQYMYLFVLLACSIILSMTVFLTVAAASEKTGEKSFYYQAGLVERSEAFIMFSLMILLPQFIYITCLLFAAMITFTFLQRFLEAVKCFNAEN